MRSIWIICLSLMMPGASYGQQMLQGAMSELPGAFPPVRRVTNVGYRMTTTRTILSMILSLMISSR